ncbi:hypothetical protein [Nocardioides sp. SYSU D00038]|uniref:hypothetical protein n=1 Tax=Nocardioides sp. SYSU D00038 TaxID=2812554 RepID=UPI001967C7F1|nr:hypothetical protein [Nocardioides sp. SYSU D00038]
MSRTPRILVLTLAALALLAGALVAAPAQAAGKPTLKPVPAELTAGKKVTLKGTVPGGKQTVKLQRRYGAGGWSTVAKVVSKNDGSYKKKVALTQAGPTSFRAVAGGKKSTVRRTTVWAWLDLTTQPNIAFGPGSGSLENYSVTINGRKFARAWVGSEASFRFVHLGGQCKTVEAWTGFSDLSRNTYSSDDRQVLQWQASNTFNPSTDIDAPEQRTAPGPAVRRALSVGGAKYLSMGWAWEDPSWSEGALILAPLAAPRALCKTPRLPELDLATVAAAPARMLR